MKANKQVYYSLSRQENISCGVLGNVGCRFDHTCVRCVPPDSSTLKQIVKHPHCRSRLYRQTVR